MSVRDTAGGNGVLLAVLLLLQLSLMAGSVRGADGSTVLEGWALHLSAPAIRAGDTVGSVFTGAASTVRETFRARARNALLEAELRRLRAESSRRLEADHENRRLRRLLEMREQLAPRSIAANVVTALLDRHTCMLVVDRGAEHGVLADQAVVAWGGAVGRVVAPVGEHHAKVWLIADPNSGVAALVQRSRAQGMAFGRGPGRLDLAYVPQFPDVLHGDRVVTSGLDGIFPRGFGLGQVISISESPDGVRTIHLEPELDLGALEEVLILLEPTAGESLALPEAGEGG